MDAEDTRRNDNDTRIRFSECQQNDRRVRVHLADAVGGAVRRPVLVRQNGRAAPVEPGRVVGDVQRAAQTDPGAALSAAPAAGPVDATLRPAAQTAVRQRPRGLAAEPPPPPPPGVDRTDGVRQLMSVVSGIVPGRCDRVSGVRGGREKARGSEPDFLFSFYRDWQRRRNFSRGVAAQTRVRSRKRQDAQSNGARRTSRSALVIENERKLPNRAKSQFLNHSSSKKGIFSPPDVVRKTSTRQNTPVDDHGGNPPAVRAPPQHYPFSLF